MTFERVLLFLNSTVGWIVVGALVILGMSIYLSVDGPDVDDEPQTPEQPSYPPVDYSVDKNRLTCILNRTPREVQDLCDKAFPAK